MQRLLLLLRRRWDRARCPGRQRLLGRVRLWVQPSAWPFFFFCNVRFNGSVLALLETALGRERRSLTGRRFFFWQDSINAGTPTSCRVAGGAKSKGSWWESALEAGERAALGGVGPSLHWAGPREALWCSSTWRSVKACIQGGAKERVEREAHAAKETTQTGALTSASLQARKFKFQTSVLTSLTGVSTRPAP